MRSGDGIGRKTAFETRSDVIHGLRIARLANGADATLPDADIRFHHTQHRVDDGHVGNHQIRRPASVRQLVVHAHAFAQALASAEHDFVAVGAA